MPKQAVRTLIQLRKQLNTIEADLAENRRRVLVESPAAVSQLGLSPGEERIVKFAGESWRVQSAVGGVRVLPVSVDESI